MFEQARTGMAVDAAKGWILALLHPATAVYAGEVLRDYPIEILSILEMQWCTAREMARVAEIILTFESIASDPGDRTEKKGNRDQ